MSNIKTIVDHFSNKIEHWTVNNPDKIMSPQQVYIYIHKYNLTFIINTFG